MQDAFELEQGRVGLVRNRWKVKFRQDQSPNPGWARLQPTGILVSGKSASFFFFFLNSK